MPFVLRTTIVHAVHEMNTRLGLKPPIPIVKDEQEMLNDLREAAKLLTRQDALSAKTLKLLQLLLSEDSLAIKPIPNTEEQVAIAIQSPEEFGATIARDVIRGPRLLPLSGVVRGKEIAIGEALDRIVMEGGDWNSIMEKVYAVVEVMGKDPINYRRTYVRDHVKKRLARGHMAIEFEGQYTIELDNEGITVTRLVDPHKSEAPSPNMP